MNTTAKTNFAEEFASLLAAALPELGVAARPDRPALEQRRCFSFQVACPSAAVTSPLSMTVTQTEITVEFLSARSRLTDPQEAVGLIRDLIEGTVIVETWFSPEPSAPAFVNVKAWPRGPFTVPGVTRIVRRSWRGTYDTDENVG
jgi:hypothetical protein